MQIKFQDKFVMGFTALLLFLLLFGSTAVVSQAADSTWNVKYWNNLTLSGDPVLERTESELDHDWGSGSPALGIVNSDDFSARWLRNVAFSSGSYRFTATTDDGMRVWVDDVLIIDSWWDSQVHSLSQDVYLSAGDHEIKVKYYETGGQAVAKLSWISVTGPTPGTFLNWKGEYFNNTSLSGTPALVRDDLHIDFDWGSGSPAENVIGVDRFSVSWTRAPSFNAGRYRFTVTADDGLRLWVNGQMLINAWNDHVPQTFNAEIDLSAGAVPIRLEYYENMGGAQVTLNWTQLNTTTHPTPAPTPTNGIGVVQTDRLNVRYGPGMQYGIITQLLRGQTVSLAGYRSSDGNWVMINWGSSMAWVSGLPLYLWTNVPLMDLPVWQGSVPATGGPITAPSGRVTYCYYLNTRTGPGTQFSIIRAVPAGTIVTLLGRNTAATWAKVQLADGRVGWMSAAYLVESVPLSSLPLAN